MEKMKKFFLITVIIFVAICTTTARAGLEPGIPLPVFNLTTLDGQKIALQDYLGKVVIVHLWKCQ